MPITHTDEDQPQLAEALDGPRPRRLRSGPSSEARFHGTMLVLACGVLLLAGVLRVREESQVLVPLLNVPLPGLCSFQRFVGLDCPGCGLTRCFISLAHGEVRQAWHYNAAGILLFGLVAFQIPYRTIQLWRLGRGLPELGLHRSAAALVVLFSVVMITQWVIKLLW